MLHLSPGKITFCLALEILDVLLNDFGDVVTLGVNNGSIAVYC